MGLVPHRSKTPSPSQGDVPTAEFAQTDPMMGQVVGGRYTVLDKLGEGASSSVYLAEHIVIQRRVALKVMPAQNSFDPDLIARFRREARAAGAVRHPAVVEVSDFGETTEHLPYIVMEWVDGETLGHRIDREGPMAPAAACRMLAQVAGALLSAHALGVVHRDLKPDNILVTPNEEVKVADFGLCAWTGADPGSKLTLDGQVFGTPHYMAPEQVEGEPVTDKCDVYALGCILFEALTGRTVFPKQAAVAVLHAHAHENPPMASEVADSVPGDLERLIARCLAKDPDLRPDMAEVEARLQQRATLARLDFVTPLSDVNIELGRWSWLRAPAAIAGVAGIVAGLLLAGLWGTFGGFSSSLAQPEGGPPAEEEAPLDPADEGRPISTALPVELVSPAPLVVEAATESDERAAEGSADEGRPISAALPIDLVSPAPLAADEEVPRTEETAEPTEAAADAGASEATRPKAKRKRSSSKRRGSERRKKRSRTKTGRGKSRLPGDLKPF